jgi:hypothetical protein
MMNTKQAIRRPMPRKNKGPCTCSICSETGSESVLDWSFCASTSCMCCDSARTTCKPIRLFFVTTHFSCIMSSNIGCPKKIVPIFYFFFLGAQCVESGVSCTDCY